MENYLLAEILDKIYHMVREEKVHSPCPCPPPCPPPSPLPEQTCLKEIYQAFKNNTEDTAALATAAIPINGSLSSVTGTFPLNGPVLVFSNGTVTYANVNNGTISVAV